MFKKILFIIVVLIPFLSFSQHFEIGVLVGGSNYFGDLSENSKTVYFNETHLAGGLFARYNINRFFAVKIGGNYAEVSGTDANSKDKAIVSRNLSFNSKIYEGSLVFDVNLPGYEPYNGEKMFSPYLFGGIAIFKFDPTTIYHNTTIHLHPLGTEGQYLDPPKADRYQLTQIAIPFGLGFKMGLSEEINLGIEIGARYLLTDYLDDVSTIFISPDEFSIEDENSSLAAALNNRSDEYSGIGELGPITTGLKRGDDAKTDWYGIIGLTISYNFMDTGLSGGRRRYRGGKTGCPTF